MKTTYLVLALAAAAAPAFALNSSGFRDAPVTRLAGDELKAFYAVVEKTLDETADGATVEWKAPRTAFTSKITPQKSFTEGRLKCREAIIDSDAHDVSQRGRYTLCKGAKGGWQFKLPAGKGKGK